MDDMELIGLDYVWRVGWALCGWFLVLGENVSRATISPHLYILLYVQVLGENVAHATISPNLYILLYVQVQCFLPLW